MTTDLRICSTCFRRCGVLTVQVRGYERVGFLAGLRAVVKPRACHLSAERGCLCNESAAYGIPVKRTARRGSLLRPKTIGLLLLCGFFRGLLGNGLEDGGDNCPSDQKEGDGDDGFEHDSDHKVGSRGESMSKADSPRVGE